MHQKYYGKEELKVYYFTAGPLFPFYFWEGNTCKASNEIFVEIRIIFSHKIIGSRN